MEISIKRVGDKYGLFYTAQHMFDDRAELFDTYRQAIDGAQKFLSAYKDSLRHQEDERVKRAMEMQCNVFCSLRN